MPAPKRLLLAFHWYNEALHRGALRRCVESRREAVTLNTDSSATLRDKPFDGIVGMLPPADHPVHRFAAESQVPVVELSLSYPEQRNWGRFPSDGEATGALAGDHLKRRPVASFLFVYIGKAASHPAREKGFRTALAGDARPVASLDCGSLGDEGDSLILKQLLGMPRPVGVFASVDQIAFQVERAARNAELSIPGDIYLVGFGNRELFSVLAEIPITTIGIDYEAWGYEAVRLLEDMIDGTAGPGTVRMQPPGALIGRASTGGEGGGDPLCAGAIALMHRTVADPPGVSEIAARMNVSKATLDRAFSAAFGTGVATKHLEIRIEVAKGLLLAGDKVESVAAEVGFASVRAFRTAFRKATGLTPGNYAEAGRSPNV